MSDKPAPTPARPSFYSTDPLVAAHPHAKVSVRWRKASATWVIYLGGRIMDSGFESAEECRQHLMEHYPELAKRADYSRA